jgi:hypothetical protein
MIPPAMPERFLRATLAFQVKGPLVLSIGNRAAGQGKGLIRLVPTVYEPEYLFINPSHMDFFYKHYRLDFVLPFVQKEYQQSIKIFFFDGFTKMVWHQRIRRS